MNVCTYPECRFKIKLALQYPCSCGLIFCTRHKASDKHNCTFDFLAENKKLLLKNNPEIKSIKINKI